LFISVEYLFVFFFFFFFQAEDGIRDRNVTGVQTCALPISLSFLRSRILFAIFNRPIVIAGGIDISKGKVCKLPVWMQKVIMIITVPIKKPAKISPNGVQEIGTGPPV